MSKIDLAEQRYKELCEDRKRLQGNIKKEKEAKDEAVKSGKTGTAQDCDTATAKYQSELNTVQEEIVKLEEAAKLASEAELNKAGDLIEHFGKVYNLRYIADMGRYISLKNEHGDPNKVNLVYKTIEPNKIAGILNIWAKKPGHFNDFHVNDIRLLCERKKLSYESLQVSFNKDKWSGGYSFNLMEVIRDQYWVKVDPRILDLTIDPNDECMKYDSLFDDWLFCLCGGKKENMDHTKNFVVQKLLYPEQFTDSGSVNPYYTGVPGGNGKGILVLVLATLFTPMAIVMSRAKEMADSFNSRQQGKVFNIIDEGDEGHISQALLKKRSGSEEIVIEGKGLEPQTMDRTESMIIFDNSGNTVELRGPGEDRRWSVMETNLVMLDYFSRTKGLSREESAEVCAYIAEIGKERAKTQKLINGWAYYVIQQNIDFYKQHKKLPKLVALHGQDYRNRLESKRDALVELFEELYPVIDHYKFIPWKWLRDIAETVDSRISDEKLSDKFDEFLKRKGHAEIDRPNSRVRVYYRGVDTGIEVAGKLRRIGKSDNMFDWAHLCSTNYAKGMPINKDNLTINLNMDWQETKMQTMQREMNTVNFRNILS
jgi:hypothetical protein